VPLNRASAAASDVAIDSALMDVLIVAVSRGYQCGGKIEEAVAALLESDTVARLRAAIDLARRPVSTGKFAG